MLNKCQIFTPIEYVNKILEIIEYHGSKILEKRLLENSCGDGNILVEVVERYINEAIKANYSKHQIKNSLEKNIIGFEIDNKVLEKCLFNLDKKASEYSISDVKWNISSKDYLKTKLSFKVDYVVGNPPYIMYQSIGLEDRMYLKENFESCKSGKFDYCYAFIEKSYIDLVSKTGKMVYLIPNSIFKNVFGQNLRNILVDSLVSIHDYKVNNIFNNATTSSAIVYLDKNNKKDDFKYVDIDFGVKKNLLKRDMIDCKWLFSDVIPMEGNKQFSEFFEVGNSVATLFNEAYVIKEYEQDEDSKLIKIGDFKIEKDVLRYAGSPRALAKNKSEFILFPYRYANKKLVRYSDDEFLEKFPNAYKYLLNHKNKLDNRNSDISARWFEYGRSQALSHLDQPKLLVSSIITNGVAVYELDSNAIPYSGFYITSKGNADLQVAKEILESKNFFKHLTTHGINANGKSLRFSVNDIKNFVIY
ncbi:Eco57I restriction-modification methylase domain-containing protein [Vagococcus sp.]|uniref:Eco57I restriction-modification methylase domain-containing protein n=1 Tax=Vagococcus sp. TaxID=1933889 RepID=UPI002FC85F7C